MTVDNRIQELMPPGVDALIVFDAVCVMCNGFARLVARFDKQGQFQLTHAQGPLGQALYKALDLPVDDFETNLVIIDGVVYRKLGSFAAIMAKLGWPWRMLAIVNWLPERLGDALYAAIASRRYRIFGRHDTCPVPPPCIRERMI